MFHPPMRAYVERVHRGGSRWGRMVSSDFLGNSFAGIALKNCLIDVPSPLAPDRMRKGREPATARAFGGDLTVAREKNLRKTHYIDETRRKHPAFKCSTMAATALFGLVQPGTGSHMRHAIEPRLDRPDARATPLRMARIRPWRARDPGMASTSRAQLSTNASAMTASTDCCRIVLL